MALRDIMRGKRRRDLMSGLEEATPDIFGGAGIMGGGIQTKPIIQAAVDEFLAQQAESPKMGAVAPPRRLRRRATDPFDFFGTLFTAPQTQALNPIAQLNRNV